MRTHLVTLLAVAVAAPFAACTITTTTTTNPPPPQPDSGADAQPAADAAPSDAASDAAPTGDGGDAGSGAALSGTLVFAGQPAGDAGNETHLYSIDFGARPFTVTLMPTTPNHWEMAPSFEQDGKKLFFARSDQDPSSATFGFEFLVASPPTDPSAATVITQCPATVAGEFCGAAQLGSDGNVWFYKDQSIGRAPLAGGKATTWFDTAVPGSPFLGCGVSRPSLTPDGAKLTTMLYPFAGCLPDDAGASPAGVYVVSVGASGIGTPVVTNANVSEFNPFVAFDRSGTHVFYTGHDDKLYRANLDGSGATLVVDHAFKQIARDGLTIVNDAWVVASELQSGASVTLTAYPFATTQATGPVTIGSVPLAIQLTWRP